MELNDFEHDDHESKQTYKEKQLNGNSKICGHTYL